MLALAHFHFHLDELFVDVELLGRSDVITRDGYRIHFALPSEEYDFGLERGRDEAAFRGGWQRNDQWTCREITWSV